MKSYAHRRDIFFWLLHFFFEAREAIALRENQALKRVARYHGQRENISHLIERMD